MAKKAGKTAAAQAAQPTEQSAKKNETGKDGFFINGVSTKNFTHRSVEKGEFESVKFFLPMNDPDIRAKFNIDPSDTKTNSCSMLFRENQVLNSTFRDSKEVDPNHKNILVCQKDEADKEMIKATVYSVKDKDGNYPNVMISPNTLKAAYEANRQEYKESQKSADKTAERAAAAEQAVNDAPPADEFEACTV